MGKQKHMDSNKGSDFQNFYMEVLKELLDKGEISRKSSILVVCGGDFDCMVLSKMGFENVTMSNLEAGEAEAPSAVNAAYPWTVQNACCLDFPDNEFEFVVVHSGLHHLPCPQKAITEMYRVSSAGILGFEPAFNLMTAIGVKLGFGQEYEVAAVAANEGRLGGLDNTAVPNYVYRFRKHDIIRCIQACAPVTRHVMKFWYATRVPERLLETGGILRRTAFRILSPIIKLAGQHFPCCANNMAFFVKKPGPDAILFPWLKRESGKIVPDASHFEPDRHPENAHPSSS